MKPFHKLLGSITRKTPQQPPEQAVLVELQGDDDFDSMVELSDQLQEAVERSGTGVFDGNEIGEGKTVLFLYGPDAEKLFQSMEAVLQQSAYALGSKVVVRWGGPGAPQRELIVGAQQLKQ